MPLLLWRRTRPYIFAALVCFHVMNTQLFSIGIFPYLMLGATTIFFDPDWPRRALALVAARAGLDPATPPQQAAAAPSRLRPSQWALVAVLGLFVAFNVLVPLRHFAYPGEVHWTEEGHRFAWHMKLRDKEADDVVFLVKPPDGEVDRGRGAGVPQPAPGAEDVLAAGHDPAGRTRAGPARAGGGGGRGAGAGAHAVSLNGRRPQPMIDPNVDLAAQPRRIGHADWIVPLRGG